MLPPKTRPRRWQASEQASKGREFATGKYGKQATGKQASKASKRLACESPNSRRGCAEPGVKTEGGGREEEEKGGREGSRHGRRPRKDGRQHETELTCKNAIVASGPFNVGGGRVGLWRREKNFVLTREHAFGGRNIEGAETSNRVFASQFCLGWLAISPPEAHTLTPRCRRNFWTSRAHRGANEASKGEKTKQANMGRATHGSRCHP